MNPLPESVHDQITLLREAGDAQMQQGAYAEAAEQFRAAFALVPAPFQDWEISIALLAAVGEAYYLLQEPSQAYAAFAKAMHVPGAQDTPFLHLRLGQLQLELNNPQRAVDEFRRAYRGGGEEVFAQEDAKYRDFFKRHTGL